MKKIFLCITISFLFLACKNSTEKTETVVSQDSATNILKDSSIQQKNNQLSKDTIVITEACAIFYQADSIILAKAQKRDDYLYDSDSYLSDLYTLLDKKKLKTIHTDNNILKFIQPNGNIEVINLSNKLWATYFFKPGSKPKLVDLTDSKQEYEQYFAK